MDAQSWVTIAAVGTFLGTFALAIVGSLAYWQNEKLVQHNEKLLKQNESLVQQNEELVKSSSQVIEEMQKDRSLSAQPEVVFQSGLGEQVGLVGAYPIQISNWGPGPALRCQYAAYSASSQGRQFYISQEFDLNAGGTIDLTATSQSGSIMPILVPVDRLEGNLGVVEVVVCRDRLARHLQFVRHDPVPTIFTADAPDLPSWAKPWEAFLSDLSQDDAPPGEEDRGE